MAPVIAVDLDEVLGDFVSPLCSFHNERYGTSLKRADFFSYRFCDVWGGNDRQATEKVHDFFKTSYFKNLPVIPGAREALLRLQELGFDLVVVTSRQFKIAEATQEWLSENFPSDTFKEVAFGNHWGLEGKKVTKLQLCQQLGASVLIDDSLSYTTEVSRSGIKCILFDLDGNYPWNKSGELPVGVTRAHSWKEVVDNVRAI
eukprot:TRINITY_DN687_c0_g1_i1.p1 TRINITY_DN687_c0_g1~~TRINITY_DN687_c0_g1_i1.p1  ORF type:complete len:202 (+),score=27.74 TRINITY_DN687_c0_g1_i1:283-888(+)